MTKDSSNSRQMRDLLPHHLDGLRRSGISDDTIKRWAFTQQPLFTPLVGRRLVLRKKFRCYSFLCYTATSFFLALGEGVFVSGENVARCSTLLHLATFC
jgi:hypothetical protein